MKGLFRKRGGGKTTALVYTSAITGYPIVVPTTINKRYVKDVARRAGVSIPEPIVMSEIPEAVELVVYSLTTPKKLSGRMLQSISMPRS